MSTETFGTFIHKFSGIPELTFAIITPSGTKLFLIITACTPSTSLGVVPCLALSGKCYFVNELMTLLFGIATYNSQSSMSTSPQEVEWERTCRGDIVHHKKSYIYLTLMLQLTEQCSYTFTIPAC